jgi:hypothetical protein
LHREAWRFACHFVKKESYMLSSFWRVVLVVVPVFIIAFLVLEYFWTGSVTNTWIGIAVIFAAVLATVKFGIPQFRRPRSS